MALSGFGVELDALITAAEGIVAAVQQFKDEDVNDLLPVRAAAGSDDLAAALDEFDDRWERGVNNLMEDVAEVGGRLAETAMEYLEAERRVAARFAALGERIEQIEQGGP
ncbi:hypothetical protein [Quadrisphaera sp. GCM10027208]|uniref:hypothetical protein n=1 Tax=Quadrisphaera sp. GCM10027208 TaxID=3273423 RepID=UPI0036D37683